MNRVLKSEANCEVTGTQWTRDDQPAVERCDTVEVVSRLEKSTGRITRLILSALASIGFWLTVKVIVTSNDAWRNDIPIRSWTMGLMVLMWSVLIWVRLRMDREQCGEQQKRALEEMRHHAQTDPLAFEGALPRLKRLSRRFSFAYGDNHEIARDVVDRVEQARAQARDLPIAHQPPAEAHGDLPRPA